MRVENVRAVTFRNYHSLELGGFGRINLLAGQNGSGKTNFLEALHLLCTAEPLVPCRLHDLTQWSENGFYLRGQIGDSVTEMGFNEVKRVLRLDGQAVHKNELAPVFPVLAFLPDDIGIITRGPEARRYFLDSVLSRTDREYGPAWARYFRALRQRNAQLKTRAADARIWDGELVKWGSQLLEKRLRLVRYLNTRTAEIFRDMYGRELELRYLCTFGLEGTIADSFRNTLERNFREEQHRQFTLSGPHRDNFEIRFSERDKTARKFASRGQVRALSVGLKTAALEIMREVTGKDPLVLIDDVLLEIDRERRKRLFGRILMKGQVFLTATSEQWLEDIAPDFSGEWKLFRVANGGVTE